MKMVDVPPCRAYVCIAFLMDSIDGALSRWLVNSARAARLIQTVTHKTVSRDSLYTGIWIVM